MLNSLEVYVKRFKKNNGFRVIQKDKLRIPKFLKLI